MKTVKVSSLKPGDIVRVMSGEYGDATVYRVDGEAVHVWRPYVHTGDVLYSGGRVVPYIGVEDFTLNPSTEVTLLRNGPPLI